MTHLDGLRIKSQPFLLVCHEVLNILALITLELKHLAHLSVRNNGAIASKLLLDHLEDFFLVKLLRQTLDGRQRFAAIALCPVLVTE